MATLLLLRLWNTPLLASCCTSEKKNYGHPKLLLLLLLVVVVVVLVVLLLVVVLLLLALTPVAHSTLLPSSHQLLGRYGGLAPNAAAKELAEMPDMQHSLMQVFVCICMYIYVCMYGMV